MLSDKELIKIMEGTTTVQKSGFKDAKKSEMLYQILVRHRLGQEEMSRIEKLFDECKKGGD